MAVPELDPDQRVVVDHASGPLLVLGGPGTGKTTALIEAVVARLNDPEAAPPLVFTFSRRQALALREQITARLGRSIQTPRVWTFHAFCLALMIRFGEGEEGLGVRLLTAPEQEFRLRETLAGDPEGDSAWPESVRAARETRAFAGEIRAVLARARQLGMDPEDLSRVAVESGRPEWSAVARFMERYLTALDWEESLDYPELVHRSRQLLTDPDRLAEVRRDFGAVFVDEFHDADPAQVALLSQLVGRGGHCVALADPDQSVFGFRGGDARGVLSFGDAFQTAAGEAAPIHVLTQSHRFGPRIATAIGGVADRLPLPPFPASVREAYRHPRPSATAAAGRVEAYAFESTGAEAEHIADLLRQARLRDQLAWSDMAVLVRSGRRVLPALSRALLDAGIPIEMAGDEIALASELAVRPLLLALSVVAQRGECDGDTALRLLSSPLGGLDALALRRLGRDLREARRASGHPLPEASAELIARALSPGDFFDEAVAALGRRTPELTRVRELSDLLGRAERVMASGERAETVLWTLWAGTSWPQRLEAQALSDGDHQARADRDLDAICALFDVASRAEELVGERGVRAFLAEVGSQQIPADTQREGDAAGRGVRLMTAHRAKGHQWRLVVVASVQEGLWPDLRVRGSLLEADRLGVVGGRWGLTEPTPTSQRLAGERRLFLTACARATERLVVTAIEGVEGEGDQPSRFLTDLGVRLLSVEGRPRRPLTLPALVGELRRVCVDPEEPPQLRAAAAQRLARLADAHTDEGAPAVPAAAPESWWGLREVTVTGRPIATPGEPIRISGSSLGALLRCPRQWFLSRRAGADQGRTTAASAGEVMHILIDHAQREGIDARTLSTELDSVWESLAFDARFLSAVERARAEESLERFVAWQEANSHREVLGTEVDFQIGLPVADDQVILQGTVDRLERLPDGRLHIVDFKTGRSKPDKRDMPTHEQLGVYQLAASLGAFDEITGGERRVGGGELVFLRLQDSSDLPYPTVMVQDSLDDRRHIDEDDAEHDSWVHARLAQACRTIRGEKFAAIAGTACQWCAFATSCPARVEGEGVIS